MKITVDYDTETKQIEVKKGGEVMSDVCSVGFYLGYDRDDRKNKRYHMDICQEGEENEGMSQRVYSVAQYLGYNSEN